MHKVYKLSLLTGILVVICWQRLQAQEPSPTVGTITFITSQNIYVQFESTAGINPGDTLFVFKENVEVPALLVGNKSSISCVCSKITDIDLKLSDKVYFTSIPVKTEEVPPLIQTPAVTIKEQSEDTTRVTSRKKPRQDISGRASISSYLNFSNTDGGNSQRMRYTFSINAKNIANTNLTGECYVSFVQRSGQWDEIRNDVWNGLKIYNLSFRYDFSENTRVWFGRKINPKLSSVGAIDGLQFETRVKSFTFGAFIGARPDYQNYSFNFDLFQTGAHVSHDFTRGKGNMQTTLAFVDQENSWNTDRRFLYFQHYNSLMKSLYFFTSLEVDLYENVDNVQSTIFQPTNFYFLLRYKATKDLTLSASYSARNNVIYYETYKSMVDRLMETSTLQGVTLQVQYRIRPKLSVGAKGSYRDRKKDPKPSWNSDIYLTYSQIPKLKISLTGSATIMQTGYINGRIFSVGANRDIIPGKVYASISYRYVDYRFYSNETSVAQNMAGLNMNWNIYRKLLLSLNYEGTFGSDNYNYSRLFINLTQRF